uniref:40S ribosomal protein S27 n=1 Tax=Bos indicus x Bos taurus TaxID=30522 RepID=A0A4W2FVD5_BOBOX
MPLEKDLLHPSPEEKMKHKKKRLVQSPNSYFMDVKCPGCYKITTVFSHAQTVVLCVGCSTVHCRPTGGKARLQKDALSDGSSTKTPLYQDEWETIPISTFCIQKNKRNYKNFW